jgi:hypothetical protein
MFVKLVLLATFFGAFEKQIFNGFETGMKVYVFDAFFDVKILFGIMVLFSNFEAKRAKNPQKINNKVNVS